MRDSGAKRHSKQREAKNLGDSLTDRGICALKLIKWGGTKGVAGCGLMRSMNSQESRDFSKLLVRHHHLRRQLFKIIEKETQKERKGKT